LISKAYRRLQLLLAVLHTARLNSTLKEPAMAGRNDTQLQADYGQALEDIASVKSTLEAAYTPEATRGDLATAVGEALSTLEDYEAEDEEEETSDGGDED
jgi:hypothetical protein